MHGTDDLVHVLRRLKLSGLLQTLELRTQQAVDDNLDHGEFLLRLLSDEIERRDGKKLQERIARAGFERERTLEVFNWLFNPNVPKSKIIDLATCHFIDRLASWRETNNAAPTTARSSSRSAPTPGQVASSREAAKSSAKTPTSRTCRPSPLERDALPTSASPRSLGVAEA
jgi:hypothetical protein